MVEGKKEESIARCAVCEDTLLIKNDNEASPDEYLPCPHCQNMEVPNENKEKRS